MIALRRRLPGTPSIMSHSIQDVLFHLLERYNEDEIQKIVNQGDEGWLIVVDDNILHEHVRIHLQSGPEPQRYTCSVTIPEHMETCTNVSDPQKGLEEAVARVSNPFRAFKERIIQRDDG